MEQYVSGRFSSTFKDLYLPTADYRMKTIFKERVEDLIQPKVPQGKLLDIELFDHRHFLKVAYDHGFECMVLSLIPIWHHLQRNELKFV